jgi:hypothetical protein
MAVLSCKAVLGKFSAIKVGEDGLARADNEGEDQ